MFSPDEAADLIEAIAARQDRAAFASLFRHYAPRVKAFIMRGGTDAETAQEVAQEALIMVWRKAASFDRSRASAATWIFTIARNKRIDLLRRAPGRRSGPRTGWRCLPPKTTMPTIKPSSPDRRTAGEGTFG
jgi:RNA polymerase sigma-70 factor (ECF subfamily)